jgi:hypothetical protein
MKKCNPNFWKKIPQNRSNYLPNEGIRVFAFFH